jgi:chorismate mutase
MDFEKKIEKHRKEIDAIDKQLVELFNKRAEQAIAIGKMKKERGIPVYDPVRENEIFRNLRESNKGPLTPDAVQRLFERIIDESRRIERDSAESKDGESKGK